MIIYKNNVKGFIEDIESNLIAEKLERTIYEKLNRRTNSNEFRSWEASLLHMKGVLNSDLVDKSIGVAIEYNLPRTSRRIDVVLSGKNKNNKEILLIVEIKQWNSVEKIPNEQTLVRTFLAKQLRETTHPSYQAYSYGKFLSDFSEVVYSNNNIQVKTCGFLHNYDINKYPDIKSDQYSECLIKAPLFYKTDVVKFREYIVNLIETGDNGDLISKIDSGEIRPGKSVQKVLRETIEDNDIFTLLDEQKVVYDRALSLIRKSNIDKQKRVLIIPGGPGTGKTIIALKLLARTVRKYEMNSVYVTKNQTLRHTFKKIILENNQDKMYTGAIIDNLFVGSGKFSSINENKYDLAIIDEAHRLIERSQYTKKGQGYDNQIREVICESKVSIFFVDEKQKITFADIGDIVEIKKQATAEQILNDNIIIFDPLKGQFRSSGADQYISFIDNLIYGEEGYNLEFKDNFDFKIFDDANEMYEAICEKNRLGNSARVLAGYCWEWKSKNNPELYDIEIGSFKKQWNLKDDNTYMVSPNSIEQIGCIHTSQGLEADYIGVIIGADLTYEKDKIKTNHEARAKSDKSLKGVGKLSDFEKSKITDELIKNTYRVLLTRAMKGCYIYCVDSELSKYIKSLIVN